MNYQEKAIDKLPALIEAGILAFDVPLKEHCSFKIGGPADILASPQTQAQFISLLIFCLQNAVPYFILGKGSNLLISDLGFRGMVINTLDYQKISRDESFVSAYCGVALSDLCDFAQQQGLSGLEFASGIPGTVGGAVFMNAGAYGGEIKDILYCSKCLVPTLEGLLNPNPIVHLKAEQHDFGYRHSVFQDRSLLHLSSVFKLSEDDPDAIKARMDDLHKQRWDKQPMDLPSAGSVFRRPEGHFVGKLIDDCGLRGFSLGNAAISDKHCGFIVNLGGATAAQVHDLIKYVQRIVLERFGVVLHTEIRFIGEM